MIPTAALPQRVTIEAWTGQTGEGAPTYDPPQRCRARVIRKGTQVASPEGTITLASAVAQIRPGRTVPAQSLFTNGVDVYEVVDVAHEFNGTRPWLDNLILSGPRPAAVATPEPEPEPEPEP